MKIFRRKKQQKDPLEGLEAVLAGMEIPSFPAATMRILTRIRDREASMDEIAEALRWEPGLVVRVLATVNSAAFGPAQTIHDVRHAASYLGRSHIEQIVLGLAVNQALPSSAAPGFDAQRFWLTAARRASLARLLAEDLHPTKIGESFTAGLLQDMAVPVLAHARPSDYGRVLTAWHTAMQPPLEELERDAFGWSHADIGGMLAREWSLPAGLSKAIAGHHSEELSDGDRLPAIRLVSILRETERHSGAEKLVELARSEYGLAPKRVLDALREANERAAELARQLA